MRKKVLIDGRISGILTIPDNQTTKIPMVLFLHGFGTNSDEVGNTFLTAAEKLLTQGIGSLRIDFSGFGESIGETSDITIDKLICDADVALHFIISQSFTDPARIGICGFSLGAGISILITNNYGETIKSMALLSPAGNLPEDFNAYFGFKDYQRLEQADDVLELDFGWRTIKLKNKFIHSLKQHTLIEPFSRFKGSFFVAAGTNDFSYNHAKDYMSKAQSSNKEFLIFEQGDHIFNALDTEKSSIDAVTTKVANWFQKTL